MVREWSTSPKKATPDDSTALTAAPTALFLSKVPFPAADSIELVEASPFAIYPGYLAAPCSSPGSLARAITLLRAAIKPTSLAAANRLTLIAGSFSRVSLICMRAFDLV